MGTVGLQFVTERSRGPWPIRAFERSWASHVDKVMPDRRLLGSRRDGCVLIREPGYARFIRTELVELETTEPAAASYYDFVKRQIRKRYDLTAIYAFAVDRYWRRPDAWFCSELVTAALEASSFVPPLASPSNLVTPDCSFFCAARSHLPITEVNHHASDSHGACRYRQAECAAMPSICGSIVANLAWLDRCEITEPHRLCHVLAKCGEESGHFHTLGEYASGAAYEGRCIDLRNCMAGDASAVRAPG